MGDLEKTLMIGSRLYHLTHEDDWNWMQKNIETGLRPQSIPNTWLHFERRTPQLKGKLFTVCGVTKDFEDWKEHGLFDYLIEHIGQYDRDYGKILQLSFPIEQEDSVYVVDHSRISPKTFRELYGVDIWYLRGIREAFSESQRRTWFEHLSPIWFKHLAEYSNSLVALQEYNGSFALPEVWYPHRVPLEKIKVEGEL